MSDGVCSDGCTGCASGKPACSGGGCGACCGRGELLLCPEEADILLTLGQYAFLPILTKPFNGEPKYEPVPEDKLLFSDCFSDLLMSLVQKHLISIDQDIPMGNVDYGKDASDAYTRCGSIALTLQGQEALDWISPDARNSK